MDNIINIKKLQLIKMDNDYPDQITTIKEKISKMIELNHVNSITMLKDCKSWKEKLEAYKVIDNYQSNLTDIVIEYFNKLKEMEDNLGGSSHE